MAEKKYDIKKYRSNGGIAGAVITGGAGIGTTLVAIITGDREMAIAGGALITGGAMWYAATYIEAYVKARIDYMNYNPKE